MTLLSINAQKKEPQAKVAPGLRELFSAPGF
jgi:hypothetical protein